MLSIKQIDDLMRLADVYADEASKNNEYDNRHNKREARSKLNHELNVLTAKREPLSDKQLASVCMSYRHDFGLLDDAEQVRLLLEARAWEHAFRKEWQRC